jgi:sec-independent protein translocase protein TatB
MFDVAWSELLLVAIVAILVVGPKELPGLLRTLGRALGKLRRQADDFRRHFDDAVREAGAEDLQREMRSLRQNNPLTQLRDSMEEAGRGFDGSDKKATPPASADDDDLGPPPPLPPRNASADTAAVENRPAPPAPAVSAPDASPAEPAASKDLSNAGPSPETRINGEHRPAG